MPFIRLVYVHNLDNEVCVLLRIIDKELYSVLSNIDDEVCVLLHDVDKELYIVLNDTDKELCGLPDVCSAEWH